MHSTSVVLTWDTRVAASLRPFYEKNDNKKHKTVLFPFLNFAIMKCQTLLEVSVGTESQVANEATN